MDKCELSNVFKKITRVYRFQNQCRRYDRSRGRVPDRCLSPLHWATVDLFICLEQYALVITRTMTRVWEKWTTKFKQKACSRWGKL